MWVFAYGSLIFRPDFAFTARRRAWVPGYARRFWQGSPDHRGVPGAPGRVVTLIDDPGGWCGGCAYQLDATERDAVMAALDHREQAGFARVELPLHDAPSGDVFARGVTYIAGPGNAHYLGPLDEAAIAREVATRRGPSGPNDEYVRRLRDALRALEVDDAHVEAVARALDA